MVVSREEVEASQEEAVDHLEVEEEGVAVVSGEGEVVVSEEDKTTRFSIIS